MKKIFGFILVVLFAATLSACKDDTPVEKSFCEENPTHEDCVTDGNQNDDKKNNDNEEEPTVIRLGSHHVPALDPNWVDPLTGEGTMSEEKRLAYKAALDIVLEELNVEIEFVEFTGDIREQFLQSVIAQDPVADVVLMWGGSQNTLLGQNVLQDLNPYVESGVFEGHEWALAPEIFGKYKFMNMHLGSDGTGFTEWPLVYNVTYIDQCPAAKAIGNPSTLWAEGNWTWDTMEDMLEALYVCYDGVPSPERADQTIRPFSTDFRYTALGFFASNGEYAVRPDGTLGYDTPAGLEVAELFIDWEERGLLDSSYWNDISSQPGWLWDTYNFGRGETVFTTAASWLIQSEGNDLAARGEKMAIVPYPVGPSATETGSTVYRNPNSPTNQWGVLKGVDAETSAIAIEAALMFFEEYYKAKGNVPTVNEYWEGLYDDVAHSMFDTLDPDHGADVLQSMQDLMRTSHLGTDMSKTYGVLYDYTDLLGDIFKGYKQDFQTEYDKISGGLENTVLSLGQIIESDEIRDTIGPSISKATDMELAFPVGTDLSADDFEYDGNDWEDYLEVVDNMSIVDYDLLEFSFKLNVYGDPEDPDKITDQISEGIDFSVPGRYYLEVTAYDDNLNEGTANFTVIIYDDSNATAPTFVPRDVIYFDPVGADLSEKTWTSYVEDARDIDGIPVHNNIEADLSDVNTTAPGEYDIILTVTDYAGNTASQTVKFRIYDDQETTRPSLEIRDDAVLDFDLNTTFISVDFSEYLVANDTLGGAMDYDISDRITVTDYNDLDNTTAGSYTITLSVSDYAGNETTLDITVNVVDLD